MSAGSSGEEGARELDFRDTFQVRFLLAPGLGGTRLPTTDSSAHALSRGVPGFLWRLSSRRSLDAPSLTDSTFALTHWRLVDFCFWATGGGAGGRCVLTCVLDVALGLLALPGR